MDLILKGKVVFRIFQKRNVRNGILCPQETQRSHLESCHLERGKHLPNLWRSTLNLLLIVLNSLSQKAEGLTRSRLLKEETTVHYVNHKKIVNVEGHTLQDSLLEAGLYS